jgi:hypothetical protein
MERLQKLWELNDRLPDLAIRMKVGWPSKAVRTLVSPGCSITDSIDLKRSLHEA